MAEKKIFQLIDSVPKGKEKKEWKITLKVPFLNCNRVHPLQQDKIAYIVDNLKSDDNINKIIIFGSSVTDQCHVGSDVDIFVQQNDKKKVQMPLCDFPFDLWTNYSVGSGMFDEIKKKGVTVYEK